MCVISIRMGEKCALRVCFHIAYCEINADVSVDDSSAFFYSMAHFTSFSTYFRGSVKSSQSSLHVWCSRILCVESFVVVYFHDFFFWGTFACCGVWSNTTGLLLLQASLLILRKIADFSFRILSEMSMQIWNGPFICYTYFVFEWLWVVMWATHLGIFDLISI